MATTRLGASVWDHNAGELRCKGAVLELTALEARFLGYLAQRACNTVSSDELLREVWEYAPKVRSRAVASTVTRLRTKLGADAGSLVTVYGRGYRLEPLGDPDLVGRAGLVARARQVLREHRWLTLYGLGGVGKSRVARALWEQGRRQCLWIPCGTLTTEPELWGAVATTLDLGQPVPRQVRLALDAAGPVLLVLDAVESLGGAASTVAESCVRACPQAQILLTTRRHVGESAAIRVDPLDPDSAVALFTRRMRRANPDQEPDEAAIRVVVDQVEGLPLGIELAAARLRLFDLPSLARRMVDDPTVVDREQHSISGVLEQSWTLLTADQQRVLAAAAQFPESFTLDQVRAVSQVDAASLLGIMEVLVRTALVLDRDPRFRMLDLVRTFCAARAEPACLAAFDGWAVGAAKDLYTQHRAGQAMLRDTPGYSTAALRTARTRTSDPTEQAWLALGLWTLLPGRAAQPLLQEIPIDALDDTLALSVLVARATAAYDAAAWDDAHAHASAGRARAAQTSSRDHWLECWTMVVLSSIAAARIDDPLRAEVAGLESAVAAGHGTDHERARALHACAILHNLSGRLQEGVGLLQRARALVDDRIHLQLRFAASEGFSYRQLGRLDLAIECLEAAWELAEEHDVGPSRLHVGIQLADMAEASGDLARAADLFAILTTLGARWGNAMTTLAAAGFRASTEDDPHKREAALIGVAERAVREKNLEEAGICATTLGRSRHERGALAQAIAAYDDAIDHLSGFGQPFTLTLAQCWRALARAEAAGIAEDPTPGMQGEPTVLEGSLLLATRSALSGDAGALDRLAASAPSDIAVHRTLRLARRLL